MIRGSIGEFINLATVEINVSIECDCANPGTGADSCVLWRFLKGSNKTLLKIHDNKTLFLIASKFDCKQESGDLPYSLTF